MCCHAEFKQDAGCGFVTNDNFANCDTMFRNPRPRKLIWVIGILSAVGAVFVIVWRTFFKEKNVVQTILLMHVAVADGLMGLYLITVGVMDTVWSGEYYLHDFQWRTGLPCQVVGGISVLSSEVSHNGFDSALSRKDEEGCFPLSLQGPYSQEDSYLLPSYLGDCFLHCFPANLWYPLFP